MTVTVAIAGLGYFSRFHLAAWAAQPGVRIVGMCDPLAERRDVVAHIAPVAPDLASILQRGAADIVDIVAPPSAHASLIGDALARDRTIICQKPFCTSIEEAEAVIARAESAGTRIVIHENFRFQPWYCTMRSVLDSGRMGTVYQARFALRPGDGRGPDAYLDRQPAFRRMPRLLVHETAVHFIDLFRWLFGDIVSVYADLRRLNPVIAGEDAGTLFLTHRDGTRSTFDGNRLSDHVATDLRRTMGEMTVEGEGGTLTLDGAGRLHFKAFGAQDWTRVPLTGPVDPDSFGGGCVSALIAHALKAHRGEGQFENLARDYLPVMRAVDAAYHSAETGRRIDLPTN